MGDAYVERDDGKQYECHSVCVVSPMGIETWLYVDKETGELLLAQQIDGEWFDLDLDEAKREFADVLYAVG